MGKTFTTGKKSPAFSPLLFAWPFLFLACFIVYLRTLHPAFPNDDSAETITAGFTLGLQHPPGYALAALLGRILSLLPLGAPSFRVNLGSALLASLAACLLAVNLFGLLRSGWFQEMFSKKSAPKENLVLFCAFAGSLLLAFSPSFWRNALGAKGGIYHLGLCLQLALWGCLLRHEIPPFPRSRAWFLLSFFLGGLGLANHWETQVVFLPAFLLFYFLPPAGKTLVPRSDSILKAVSFLLLATSPLLYMPLRAHAHPVLNLGAPDTWTYFRADLSRHYVADRETSLLAALGHFFNGTSTGGPFFNVLRLILKVQGRPISDHLLNGLGVPALLLAILGLFAWLRSRERKVLLFTLLSLAFLLLALLSSLRIPDDPNQKWILDNFLMPADWIVALLAAVGMGALLSRLRSSSYRFAPLVFLMLGAVPLLGVTGGWENLNSAKATLAYDYGENLLKSIPRNSIFFAEGDADYFSLFYLQNVARRRPDIRMIPTFTLFEPWGVEQIEGRFPEMGLTAAAQNFPDHFARILYSTSEIIYKNKDKALCTFSYFNGAFHRFYLSRHPSFLFRKSGVVLELNTFLAAKGPWLTISRLRVRHILDCPSNGHPSLGGIWNVYQKVGFSL